MIRQYLKDNLKHILFYTLVLSILFAVAALYQQLKGPIYYSILLISILGAAFMFLDCRHYCARIAALHHLAQTPENCAFSMPASRNGEELAYQDLIRKLNDAHLDYVQSQEAKYRDRSEYFAMWAHQIKTPIAALHLLMDDVGTAEEKEQLFRIEEYVSLVMHYLKSDDISKDFILREYDLDPILEEAIRHYSSLFIRKKLKLNYQKTHLRIVTDEKWLLFVIEQILSNSLKYTAQGSISIYARDHDLYLQDTGCGIAAEDLPKMFDKGYTGYNGRADKRSTGLGLYLCRKVLNRISHTIRITSGIGRGTTVIIGLGACRNVSNPADV